MYETIEKWRAEQHRKVRANVAFGLPNMLRAAIAVDREADKRLEEYAAKHYEELKNEQCGIEVTKARE
jgi:hypothetical protein